MTKQQHNFPLIAPVAPSASDNGEPAKIPDLTIADFPLDFEGVYHLNQMGMAQLLDDRRGLPNRLLVHGETRLPIHIVTGEYTAIPNQEAHVVIKDALTGMFPRKYLQNVGLVEKVENGCAYSQMDYHLNDFSFSVSAGKNWETKLSPVVSVKNAAQHSLITIVGAKCSMTENILSLGAKAAHSQRHVGKFTKEPIEKHLRFTLMQFPKVAQAMQSFADQVINVEQAKNAIHMYTNMTDNVQADILEQFVDVTAAEMGTNKLALLMAVADFACDAEAFPVKNSAKADNIAETLATRKKWMAGLVSSPFFFGRGGFYA